MFDAIDGVEAVIVVLIVVDVVVVVVVVVALAVADVGCHCTRLPGQPCTRGRRQRSQPRQRPWTIEEEEDQDRGWPAPGQARSGRKEGQRR